jgi:hypothetical protein
VQKKIKNLHFAKIMKKCARALSNSALQDILCVFSLFYTFSKYFLSGSPSANHHGGKRSPHGPKTGIS